ncbi:DUF2946 domain-containing protein [Herbaspirillum rubrisubalbicans]|jgi:hypothetical protein|uniref:DUF2946 domain-containing protein n=1 Tax=Herbaspirillum rubrisubalbicans TaxID=80842 RepID=UPI001558726D|nr:DUF2946 domain-containing protein [Herbaspirillum rubrisubalbicans]
MSLGRRLHRSLAWLALCVVVFAAAAPTISRTLAANSQLAWMEVCSASGTQRIAVPATRKAGQEPIPADGSHCGYCVLQQHAPAPPSTPASAAPQVLVLAQPLSIVPELAVVPGLAPTAHRSRAPPILL